MPNKTGFELLKELRDTPGFKNTPFIMVTAEAAQSNMVQAVSEGVNCFVTKPVAPRVLQEEIERVLK